MCPNEETKHGHTNADGRYEEHDNSTEIMHRTNLDLSAPPRPASGASCGCKGNDSSGLKRGLIIALFLAAAVVLAVVLFRKCFNTMGLSAIPRVHSVWTLRDTLGAWKARCNIGRMGYGVLPGLYALNRPEPDSPVLVSANYKMSFDILRRAMAGRPAWILVIDTKAINVWCAAGKGTFGTAEIVFRVNECGLASAVTHRRLIIPQLGAPGTAAHEVRAQTGFSVTYGPVNAADLPAFLDAGSRTDARMRAVTFTFRERLALVPVELTGAARPALIAAAIGLLLSGLTPHGYDLDAVRSGGLLTVALLFLSVLSGAVVTPLCLPWIPGRAFAVKGALSGGLAVLLLWLLSAHFHAAGALSQTAWSLMIPAFSSFLSMNFTGATPFTSLSGVLKEMRLAVPMQAAVAGAGVLLWIAGRFIGGGQ